VHDPGSRVHDPAGDAELRIDELQVKAACMIQSQLDERIKSRLIVLVFRILCRLCMMLSRQMDSYITQVLPRSGTKSLSAPAFFDCLDTMVDAVIACSRKPSLPEQTGGRGGSRPDSRGCAG
jgi:hypothetical protein